MATFLQTFLDMSPLLDEPPFFQSFFGWNWNASLEKCSLIDSYSSGRGALMGRLIECSFVNPVGERRCMASSKAA